MMCIVETDKKTTTHCIFSIAYFLCWLYNLAKYTVWYKIYALSINNTCVRRACKVKHHYLFKILWITFALFSRNIPSFIFIDCSFKQLTQKRSYILKTKQPGCLYQKSAGRYFLHRHILVYWICICWAISNNIVTHILWTHVNSKKRSISIGLTSVKRGPIKCLTTFYICTNVWKF